ncbi:MAG: CRISPR-associated protein, partial [Bacteroidales bacterium]|nr:CRISPR-associated protein [Bacteroidales bacterium]
GKYIDKLVEEYLAKIEAIPNVDAVHVMGEFNFCYKIINELKKRGIKCLASCTKRDTVEENGVKISKFKFVQFREY